jgi:hypothetical protein
MSTASDQESSEAGLIIELLREARGMIGSLQTQITDMRAQTWDTTRNLDLRIRAQEQLHGALLYAIAGTCAVALVLNVIALGLLAATLLRIAERLP